MTIFHPCRGMSISASTIFLYDCDDIKALFLGYPSVEEEADCLTSISTL